MTKTEKALAEKMAAEMIEYTKKQWAAFNRTFAASVAVASKLEIQKAAYKLFLESTEDKMLDAGGHVAQVSVKAGASYVDYAALLEELAEQGIDTNSLVKRHTKRRAETMAFSFK